MTQYKVGSPLPFGVSEEKSGHNFSLFSQNATQITLVIVDSQTEEEIIKHELCPRMNKTGDIWHILLTNLPERFDYFYFADGYSDFSRGLLFNKANQLIDPYTRLITGLETWGKKSGAPLRGRYEPSTYDWAEDKPLNYPLNDTIIYELHVRGFTKKANLPDSSAGTFKGLQDKIPYLKQLGITTVELMPIHEFNETDCAFITNGNSDGIANFWGYSSISFFALKSSYSSVQGDNTIDEFKDTVKALHSAGIEVVLDVVFNHTAERGDDGETINFKGLENGIYYHLDTKGKYKNYSGCGNTMNCNHPVVRKMIIDSLRYWVAEMHIDGFRFDLASILSRDESGRVLSNPPLLELIAKDPILAKTKIIAEAWDPTGLYQVGSFPASKRWAEWNGKYRDIIRRFCLGEPGITGEVATRIAGSEDLYRHSARNPYHSINFITSHDGFTMMDLVSYEFKNNFKNGEQNRDGEDVNYSQNFGFEGQTTDPLILKKRQQQILNMATILMVSQGTPMMLAGDEFGRTQRGNNNAWCQDNEISWLDWDLLHQNKTILQFWKKLISFRKSHPTLRRNNFFSGSVNPYSGIADISWHGVELAQPRFNEPVRNLAFLVDGFVGEKKVDDNIYVILNFEAQRLNFQLPKQYSWQIIINTAQPQEFINGQIREIQENNQAVLVESFSVLVLLGLSGEGGR